MCCVKSSKLSVLWNGSHLESFELTCGLRQEDPMSSYLFILCMEKLALYTKEKVAAEVWKPIYVARGGPGISHLLFADNILLFCHASSS